MVKHSRHTLWSHLFFWPAQANLVIASRLRKCAASLGISPEQVLACTHARQWNINDCIEWLELIAASADQLARLNQFPVLSTSEKLQTLTDLKTLAERYSRYGWPIIQPAANQASQSSPPRTVLGRLTQTGDQPRSYAENKLPGHPIGVHTAIDSGTSRLVHAALRNGRLVPEQVRYIETKRLTAEALGYATEPRQVQGRPLDALEMQLENFQPVDVRESQVLLLSVLASGTSSYVKLGWMGDRPVALRRCVVTGGNGADTEQFAGPALQAARGTDLLSRLGVGPRFYGLYTHNNPQSGKPERYEVTDIVPGDFPEVLRAEVITSQTFGDLETVFTRLESVESKVDTASDFQFYVTPSGRLVVIDGTPMGVVAVRSLDEIQNRSQQLRLVQRAKLIGLAKADVALAYMKELRQENPSEWAHLVQYLKKLRDNAPLGTWKDLDNRLLDP